MGEADIRVKNFIKINSVFAQLFRESVFKGKMKIDPDKLKELDTVNQETVRLEDGQLKDLERLRDIQKITMLFDDRMAFQIIMGVEAQSEVNYYMPVRCMELDALSYSYQCRRISEKAKEAGKLKKYSDGVPKGTKVLPTVTLVFYFGDKPWDGPLSIYDMLDIPDTSSECLKEIIPDYPMHIIDAKHLTEEETDRFEGDLKAFLLMIQGSYNRDKLKTAVATHRETWYAISAVKKDKRYVDYIENISEQEIVGGVNMDAVLDRLIEEGKAEGVACVNKLGAKMAESGRTNEFIQSLTDVELQRRLFIEFKIDTGK